MKKLIALMLATALVGCTGVEDSRVSQGLMDGSGAPLPSDPPPPPPPDGGPGDGDGGGDGSGGTCSSNSSCGEDESCDPGGVCEECNAIEVNLAEADAPPPPPPPPAAPMGASAIGAQSVPAGWWAEVLLDGTILVKDALGNIMHRFPQAMVRDGAGWMLKQTLRNPLPEVLRGMNRWVFRCAGVIAALMGIAELAHAGMDAALGDAAAAMGVRQQECQERFGRAAAGIQCLRRQSGSCSDAVAACPDAFFGANLMQTCGAEPGVHELVTALAQAIAATSVRAGGHGTLPDPAGQIAAAIQSGQFATNPQMTCSLRPIIRDCQFLSGSVFTVPGFNEAKACWEGASRGIFQSKYEEAQLCCAGNAACLTQLAPMQDC